MKIINFLCFIGLCFGQSNNTVFQTLATNTSTASTLYGPVTNIGQSLHEFYMYESAIPAHTCVTANTEFNATFFGNYINDISSALQIPAVKNNTIVSTSQENIYAQAIATFPYIWVGAGTTNNANCRFSLYYAGTKDPATPITFNDIKQPLTQVNFGAVASGNQAIISGLAGKVINNYIYRLALTATTATTFTFSCDAVPLIVYAVMANTTIYLDTNVNPHLTCVASSTLNLNASTATGFLTYWYTVGR